MDDPGEVHRITAHIPISDEVLTGHASLQAAIVEALNNPQPPKPPPLPPPTPVGHLALLDATDGAPRALVDHHEPVWYGGAWGCDGCDFSGYDGEPAFWPCSTVELIAQQLDVDLTEGGSDA